MGDYNATIPEDQPLVMNDTGFSTPLAANNDSPENVSGTPPLPPAPMNDSPVNSGNPILKNKKNKKVPAVIATIFALILIVGGLVAGTKLVGNQQLQQQKAATTLPDGQASGCCSGDSQCASWFGAGSTCSTANGACSSGKQCHGSTCTPTHTCTNSDCGVSNGCGQLCNGGCNGACGGTNQACCTGQQNACNSGLTCFNNFCVTQTPTVLTVGQSCEPAGSICASNLVCQGPTGSRTCQVPSTTTGTTNCTGGGNSPINCPTGTGISYQLKRCTSPTNTATSYPGCVTSTNCVDAGSWPGGTLPVPGAPACGTTQLDVVGYGGMCAGSGIACTSPTPTPTGAPTAQCTNIGAYSTAWSALSAAQLTALKPGDTVYFTVTGTTTGSFDQARFTINGTLMPAVSTTQPGNSAVYYTSYTIPVGVTSFTVGAELHSVELNQWF